MLVDGWLRTGDLVHENDDGTYTFVGRRKEVIRRRGENLSPTEVEAAVERHPAVAEAAVIGVPSDLSEEDVKAFVVPADGRRPRPRRPRRPPARPADAVQGAALLRGGERAAPHPHRPPGQAPAPDGAHRGRGRHGRGASAVAEPREPLHTWIGSSTPDSITLAGRDLPSEVMGRLSLTELTFLLMTRREPSAGERRLLDAVLVSLADHGLTPSALAARLTYTGAPEAIQGAVAAGLLGAGSVFLGPAGDTAEFLAAALAAHGRRPRRRRAGRRRAPGGRGGAPGRPPGPRPRPPGPQASRPPHAPALRAGRGGGVARPARSGC